MKFNCKDRICPRPQILRGTLLRKIYKNDHNTFGFFKSLISRLKSSKISKING